MPPNFAIVPAAAKINLSLHVCGKRGDGYHLLDSLVCFAGVGDVLSATKAPDFHLQVVGPFAAGLENDDNLVLRAARFLATHTGTASGAHFILEKCLPVASGIGGGSSDAAAALHACSQLWNVDLSNILVSDVAHLGADIPVCVTARPARMTGIGEKLELVPALPPAWMVLVNPMKPLATKTVFAALQGRYSGAPPALPPRFDDLAALVSYLSACTNDLAAPATEALPDIALVVAALNEVEGCLLARLSGSGPTCFGLFASDKEARAAAAAIAAKHPGWWVVPTPMSGVT